MRGLAIPFLCSALLVLWAREACSQRRSEELSPCFLLERVGHWFDWSSFEISTRAPNGRWRKVGAWVNPGVHVRDFEGDERNGAARAVAVSGDGQSIVYFSNVSAGRGSDRIAAGVHRYVCGVGDTLLYTESQCGEPWSFNRSRGLPGDVMVIYVRDTTLNPGGAFWALRADGRAMPLALLDAPALFSAAYDGRSASIDSLMDLGADPNATNLLEMTPLDVALWAGHEDAAIRLIRRASFDTTSLERSFCATIQFGRWQSAAALIERGADPNRPIVPPDRPRAITPLELVLSGSRETGRFSQAGGIYVPKGRVLRGVPFLLDHGGDPNGRDPLGESALHMVASDAPLKATAIFGEYLDTVRLLFERGADVMQPSATGETPLHVLVGENGLPGSRRSASRSSADTSRAWEREPFGQLLVLFVGHAKNLDTRDASGSTPLQRAIAAENFLAAQYLVEHGASVNVDYKGHPIREILAEEAKNRSPSKRARFTEEFSRRYGRAPR